MDRRKGRKEKEIGKKERRAIENRYALWISQDLSCACSMFVSNRQASQLEVEEKSFEKGGAELDLMQTKSFQATSGLRRIPFFVPWALGRNIEW